MIPVSALPLNTTPAWRIALREALREPAELLALLGLDAHAVGAHPPADTGFRMLVPRGYVARMRPGDPHDPLLLQVLPQARELLDIPGYVADPVGDLSAEVAPGVLHKYHGRVLLVSTGACAIHCRYCFRRHFPYAESNPSGGHWQDALSYLRAHPEVEELILSGGDPLVLDDAKLGALVRALADIPHLRRLRLHTRLPVVLPERIDSTLLDWIRGSRLRIICVIHANHANELDANVAQALSRLHAAGAHLLNQSVLLKGVNDSSSALDDLSQRLFECRVLPYYLHLLDPVAGAAHFHVDDATALRIMQSLRARLPGYLVPKLVREQAGKPSKTPVFSHEEP
ncbi:EF-P beta-lysylation protein EpmB [Acidihalobacter ferrooxydans]|uniref:L-lysine 2,3-aminomutase n=1 Tax=Acidihalobacter ferrooxydans TaxID=1765967 RepID=A0A1P8UEZ0_9GAMM|nr:EF-P beta-lysylation protein EpmB [Acidihalobacter ferrooxydans]APZ42391.1 EF-P beta-lysylation protein EpmB [Acidihalobacter ferrooxydans]